MRIAIAGFQHETNTFAANKTGLSDFLVADSWPELLRGPSVLTGTEGLNLPIAGCVAGALARGNVDLVPILWCAAEPASHVTVDAFETITGWIVDGVKANGPLDGIYLDLHGAMVVESHADGEAELLRRLRSALGDGIPIAISLDLHANLSPSIVDLASAIAIYRTYPHLDMADTGRRAFDLLADLIEGRKIEIAYRQIPFLIPLHAQYTGADPCRGLYEAVRALDQRPGVSADLALGFTAADTGVTGASIVVQAPTAGLASACADDLLAAVLAEEGAFDTAMLSPDEAVRQAMAMETDRPVVIADVQDNPGAGGTSDTTGLLSALVRQHAQGAVLGLLCDPYAVEAARQAGVGGEFGFALGGRGEGGDQEPFHGRFRVETLGPGRCVYTGAMYGGGEAVLGPCAVLSIVGSPADVQVVVSSQRSQCLDLALFTHIGIDPRRQRIVCVKSTVHFRADFEPIAEAVLIAEAPGAFGCRLDRLPFRHLRPGLRLGPLGPPCPERA